MKRPRLLRSLRSPCLASPSASRRSASRPVGGRPDLLLKCAGADPFDWITRVLLRGPLSRRLTESWSPDFLDGLPVEPRANGWSITRNRLDFEIHEDGFLRLRSGDLDYT